MYHIILIAIAYTMTLGVWNLVHSSPRSLLLFLPPQVAFVAGAALFIFGVFFAFAAAVLVQNGAAMLGFMLEAHIGLYLLVVRLRDDEDTVRRSFLMMGALLATLIAIFYVQDAVAAALLMVALLGTGYYVFSGSPRYVGRDR